MLPKDAIADSGLRSCRSWNEVQQVLQRMPGHAQQAPKGSAICVEVWAATAKNAVLWAIQSSPSSCTGAQALALLHGVLRDMHMHLLRDEHVGSSSHNVEYRHTHSSNYYVSVFEKLVRFAPTTSVHEFGLVLAYCYIYESLLGDATVVTNILSSMAASGPRTDR